MENIYLKLYQLLNKQAPQIDSETLQYHPSWMDISQEKGFISPEEAALYNQVLSRAQKDKVITPYSNETFKKARSANSEGFIQGYTGNISKDLKEKLLKKYPIQK